jgi:nitrite reductase/ring-hydroxylating ferredoxin subunit
MTKELGIDDLRRPTPTYQDILRRDGDAAPSVLQLDSNPIPPTQPVAFSRYTSQEFFDREMDKMWANVWQFACREEDVANPGDYVVYDIGRHSVIILRTEAGALRAYHNSCLHRGTQLKPRNSLGTATRIQCPYHGWTWNLEGALVELPCDWEFPHVDRNDMQLEQARVDTWNSLVFVNLSAAGPTLLEYLEVLPEHFRNWDFSGWYTSVHARKELPCNWKAAQDAFIEAYHTLMVHPQAVGTSGDINQQHDIFGDHVSRDIVALGVSSPRLDKPLDDAEILQQMLMGDAAVLGERPELVAGETARTVMARNVRETMTGFGLDVSQHSTAETIDSIKYTLFPNLFIFAGLSLRVLYQYRPLGNDPDRCTFDIMFMRPVPAGEPRPEPAPITHLGEDDSYMDVPGMDPGFGELFDQDTNILRLQRDGMHASKRGVATFSIYLESRLRHIHNTLDKYLNA